LRFRDCIHVVSLDPVHNPTDNHAHCYVCHPELQNIPLPGTCPECDTAGRYAGPQDSAKRYPQCPKCGGKVSPDSSLCMECWIAAGRPSWRPAEAREYRNRLQRERLERAKRKGTTR
jgi:predicted amidophosphoribosyltransferase